MDVGDLYWTQAGFSMWILAFVYTDWLMTATGKPVESFNGVFVLFLSGGAVFLMLPLMKAIYSKSVKPKLTRGDELLSE